MLENVDKVDSTLKRLSIATDEIEEFQRDFIGSFPKVRSATLTQERPKPRRPPKSLRKHLSTTTLSSSKLISSFCSSQDSVFSGYDSGAYSRESTPDCTPITSSLSMAHSLPLISPRLVLTCNNIATEDSTDKETIDDELEVEEKATKRSAARFTEVVFANTRNSQSSSPSLASPRRERKRPTRSKSQSAATNKQRRQVRRWKSSARSVWDCGGDCSSTVTVNGQCYHV